MTFCLTMARESCRVSALATDDFGDIGQTGHGNSSQMVFVCAKAGAVTNRDSKRQEEKFLPRFTILLFESGSTSGNDTAWSLTTYLSEMRFLREYFCELARAERSSYLCDQLSELAKQGNCRCNRKPAVNSLAGAASQDGRRTRVFAQLGWDASTTARAAMLTTPRDGDGGRQDVGGESRAEQDRTDMQAVGHGLDHAEGDVGRIEVREDQQVRFAGKRAVRHHVTAQAFGDGAVAVHFAVDFQLQAPSRERAPGRCASWLRFPDSREPKFECETRATRGEMPKRLISSAAQHRRFWRSLRHSD